MDSRNASDELASHVAESVDAIVSLHNQHYSSAPTLQRIADWLTDKIGRPLFVACTSAGVAVWVMAAIMAGRTGEERSSFDWLELSATLCALLIAMLILATQRREDQMADRRARLTLEISILAERKTAKLISLIEELRKDLPEIGHRYDAESTEMSAPTDPKKVLEVIEREETRSLSDTSG